MHASHQIPSELLIPIVLLIGHAFSMSEAAAQGSLTHALQLRAEQIPGALAAGMHTCILGRSIKFRSVLSSPKHSTGTTLAFCCIASRIKPAQRAGVGEETRQLMSPRQLSCPAGPLHPCKGMTEL